MLSFIRVALTIMSLHSDRTLTKTEDNEEERIALALDCGVSGSLN